MSDIKSVCVYCGSSPGNDIAYTEAGEQLGAALAAARIKLIYGGGTTGIMGAVSRAVLENGGEVGAIIPGFLVGRETTKAAMTMFTDVTVTETMHERKQQMFERSDAFVALPGGIGTIEEIVEIMTWSQLGQHRKPMIFANVKGFWNPMISMLDHVARAGFIHTASLMRPLVVDWVDDILPAIAGAVVGEDDGSSSVMTKM